MPEAGFLADQIWTSDVSLLSSLLGYYYADLPLASLGFSLAPFWPELPEPQRDVGADYDALTDDSNRLTFLV
jgi:hypothetical protein